MKFFDKVKQGWNVFRNAEEEKAIDQRPIMVSGGSFGSRRPDRRFFSSVRGSDITAAIYNRIAVDASGVSIRHVKLDKNGRFSTNVSSGLNNCLTLEANIDQNATAFRQDIFQTMLEEGTVVVVPTNTDDDPDETSTFSIETMRVGTVLEFRANFLLVRCFDDRYNRFEDLWLPKSFVAPVENPFYAVMNDNQGTLKRLVRKIRLLDAVDEMIGSGKLDLIIQLPYIVKTDSKKAQAEKRRAELEEQLAGSQYGVAYTDGTERITQLNRPVENNLLKNVESLTAMLYTQLGLTEEVMNGTATEEAMMNYNVRTIKPLLDAVTESLKRKFLTKTAITQGHSIEYFQNPFALVPIGKFADLTDKLSRNAILSANEIRSLIGYPPVDDPNADALVNKNMPQVEGGTPPSNPLDDTNT